MAYGIGQEVGLWIKSTPGPDMLIIKIQTACGHSNSESIQGSLHMKRPTRWPGAYGILLCAGLLCVRACFIELQLGRLTPMSKMPHIGRMNLGRRFMVLENKAQPAARPRPRGKAHGCEPAREDAGAPLRP